MVSRKKGVSATLSSLFAALISVSCFIQIPLPVGIPIIVQDMMCMMSGMLLGPLYGTASVLIFLALGCLGLPVFSGKGGWPYLISGPTSGFLCCYALAAFLGGTLLTLFLSDKKEESKAKSIFCISFVAFFMTAVLFLGGILGFMRVTKSSLEKTLTLVLFPFIPGNIIKILLMVPLTLKFRPIIQRYTTLREENEST